MKLDNKRRQTLTARRTLKNFLQAFENLLRKKPFEKITVSDICEEAMIPRATFYNYFEDKYDLLDYFCTVITDRFSWNPPDHEGDIEAYLDQIVDMMLHSMRENVDVYRDIYQTNASGYFILDIRNHVRSYLAGLLEEMDSSRVSMPIELESDILASIVTSIGTWYIYHTDEYSLSDVTTFLKRSLHRDRALQAAIRKYE